MLVHKPTKKLLLNLKDPARVLDVIPGSKSLEVQGKTLVSVPHGDDEVRVLRNLGFDPPTPIETYYDWPCRYDGPMRHQRITVPFLTLNPRAYCTSGMGSGKTLCGLWAYDWLRATGRAKRMLVLAPLSTLQRTWADEVFTHFPHLQAAVLHGTAERRLKLLAVPHDVYIINHDAVKSKPILDALCARADIDVVLVDELAIYRTPGTERFKAVNRLIKDRAYAWGFTGTPTPNAPTDAWAQCRLITPHTVPKFMGQFRDQTMRQFGPFKWVARENANDVVQKAMQPCIRFSREECIDLPPTTHHTREVPLTPEQSKAYNEMLKSLKMEYQGGQVLAVNEAVKLGKLVQICCLSANTLTLTRRGWVPLATIRADDEVWDGIEWVGHSGLIARGRRPVVTRSGVTMTPDHLVMTDSGWVEAERIRDGDAGGGLDWYEVRLPGSDPTPRFDARAHEVRDMAVPVRMRDRSGPGESEPSQDNPTERPQLRVPARGVEPEARYGANTPVPHMGEGAPTMLRRVRQRLAELWWAGHSDVRQVGRFVSGFLGRHAERVRAEVDPRARGQRWPIQPGKLPVGDVRRTDQQPKGDGLSRHAAGQNEPNLRREGIRPSAGDTTPPLVLTPVVAGSSADYPCTEVYDLAYCGPRNRFTVRAEGGRGMLVHNCGAAYDINGAEVPIPCGPRIEVVREVIDEAEGKVIVFVPYTSALVALATALGQHFSVEMVYGATSRVERDRIFKDFQQAASPRVIVADARTMSHGLSLTRANTIVWYGPTTSTETYLQANERIPRPGQKLSTHIVHIESTPVERAIYDRLRQRTSMQGALLDLLKAGGK